MAKGNIVRWITVKGRRIPIYEDGSMGGFMEGKTRSDGGEEERLKIYKRQLEEVQDELDNAPKSKALRDEKAIAELEKKKAELESYIKRDSAKSKHYAVYQPSNILGTEHHTRLERIEASSEEEAIRKYKEKYPNAADENISLRRTTENGSRYQNEDGSWDDGHSYKKAGKNESKPSVESKLRESLRKYNRPDADKEAYNMVEAYKKGQIEPERLKMYGITDEELKSLSSAGRKEAQSDIDSGRAKKTVIDPLGNIRKVNKKTAYEKNYGEDLPRDKKSIKVGDKEVGVSKDPHAAEKIASAKKMLANNESNLAGLREQLKKHPNDEHTAEIKAAIKRAEGRVKDSKNTLAEREGKSINVGGKKVGVNKGKTPSIRDIVGSNGEYQIGKAYTKSNMMEIAEAAGIPRSKTSKMTVAELRKMMLAMWRKG